MDVMITLLNEDLVENVCMSQPTGFKEVGNEHMVCKLQKFIYGLKQASKQRYLKFDEDVTPMVSRRTSSINAYIYEGR